MSGLCGDAISNVRIGRTSGPITDVVVETSATTEEIKIMKDTLAMVNKVTNNKEGWFIQVGQEGSITVPEVKTER